MARCDYSNKRFLIIDSLKPSRDILKQLAFNLDANLVEATGYARDILTKCSENHYDILLLGYDLGEKQKNGQQLLEELRTSGLVNRQSVVILITAESSQAMVLAALEHKPDDYLTKPYRLNDLIQRLDKCYIKKQKMAPIYKALDEKSPQQAIDLCQQAISNNTPYITECFGIKSRQHLELDQINDALHIYQKFEHRKNCQWATIGLGKIALLQEEFDKAIEYFLAIIEQYPLYLSSYDWLATSYEKINLPIKAQDTLETAITISPLSVKRIKRFAELCFKNEAFDKATEAFDRNYQLSHQSIHHKPENAFKFSESLNQYADELTEVELKRLKNRVVNALNETSRTFNTLDVRLQSQLHSVRLMQKTHEEYDAKRLLKTAESLINKIANELSPEGSISIADLLIKLNRRDAATPLLAKVTSEHNEELNLMTQVDKLVDDNLKSDDLKFTQLALDEASISYHNKDYQDAYKRLHQAHLTYPKHVGIQLNLIQVLLALFKTSNNKQYSVKAKKLIDAMTNLPSSHSAYYRYQILTQQYKTICEH